MLTKFYPCTDPAVPAAWREYRDRSPKVQGIEAAAIEERRADLANIIAFG